MKLSINLRLLTSFLVVLLLLILLTIFSLITSRTALESSVGGQSVFLANSLLKTLKKNIQLEIDNLTLEVRRDSFLSIVNDQMTSPSGRKPELPPGVAHLGDQISVLTPTGLNPQLSDYLDNRFFRLPVMNRDTNWYHGVFLTDTENTVIAAAGIIPYYRHSDDQPWKLAKEKGYYVGEQEADPQTQVGVIPMLIRVNDKNGNFIGMLGVNIISSIFFQSLAIGAKTYHSTEIHVFSLKGERIFSSQTGQNLADLSETDTLKKFIGNSGYFITEKGNKKKLFTYAKAQGYLNLNFFHWIMVLENDQSEITAPIKKLTLQVLIALAIIILMVFALAIMVSRSIILPIKALQEGIQVVSNGKLDYQIEVKSSHEIGELCTSFNIMTTQLKSNVQQIERENWLKTGQANLSDQLRGVKDTQRLADLIISNICQYLNASTGAVYLMASDDTLELAGAYAYPIERQELQRIRVREGFIGQIAGEGKLQKMENVPESMLSVDIGAVQLTPRNFIGLPFYFEKELMGIVFLASVKPMETFHQVFLERVMDTIGITFQSVRSQALLQDLLEETQQQSEELRSQQEELKVANEELEKHTVILKDSEAKLQLNQKELSQANETLQKRQEELRQTNEELEEKTETLELKQIEIENQNKSLQSIKTKLEEKAKDLELSNRYKSEFLSNMSHELRSPLNSLLIFAQLLYENKDGNLHDKQVKFAKNIHTSGVELLELINDILDLSKIEAGHVKIKLSDLYLKEIPEYLNYMFREMVEQKGLSFDISMGKDLPGVLLTDSQRLFQILKNLLSNALKFTETGGIDVQFSRLNQSGNHELEKDINEFISIAVKDTGIGIPHDKRKIIFEAFQQANGSTSRQYGGTGLGLSISRQLSALLQGRLELTSEENQGSTFTLIIPINTCLTDGPSDETVPVKPLSIESPTPVEPDQTVSPPSTEQQDFQTEGNPQEKPIQDSNPVPTIKDDRESLVTGEKSILIIDDDVKFAQILLDLGRENKFKCVVTTDGVAGLAAAGTYLPSAIILDINLPLIDGWAVMEKLKTNPKTSKIPVHFISASDRKMMGLKMGAIGFLTKPVSLDKLNQAFKRIDDTISKKIKQVLIVEEDKTNQKNLVDLFKDKEQMVTHLARNAEEALTVIHTKSIDLLILDLRITDMDGYGLLSNLEKESEVAFPPVIVHTGKYLAKNEETKLKQYTESIILEGVESSSRLLDEVSLFLHRVESDLPAETQNTFALIHDQEDIFKNRTILLVDDDMRNVYALMAVLGEKQMNVLVATNGKEALDMLADNPDTDLVLMDIMMPVMNTIETMKRIRAEDKWAKLPIIALTAKAMPGDRQQCLDAGANDYLTKPVEIHKLLSLARVWLYN